jgi:hypothetical protein
MQHVPLSEACLSEVLARVSYRIIQYRYNHFDYDTDHGSAILLAIALELQKEGWLIMEVWVRAYHREVAPMTPTKSVRDAFIFRARQGYTWRRVVFPQYKRNRSDPPVSNTGVAREGSAGEEGQ